MVIHAVAPALGGTSTNKRRIRLLTASNCDILAIYLISLSTFATLVSIFGPTIYIVEHHHNVSMDVRSDWHKVDVIPPVAVDVDDLAHEELFRNTIKSCLPSENDKCKEFVPEPIDTGKKMQRVAFLAPPGDVSDSLYKRVQQVVAEHNVAVAKGKIAAGGDAAAKAATTADNVNNLPIDLILTTHVPPYGYGKTHGYTKVIRLVPEPLLLEVTDALTSILPAGVSHSTLRLADVQAALRMTLRFHCRLSHLSAHTALLSIPLLDLLSDATETMAKIRSFLNSKAIDELSKGGGDEGEEESIEFTLDDDQGGLMDAELAYGSQILTSVQNELQLLPDGVAFTNDTAPSVYDVLDQVVLDEMRLTKDMSAWPCPSFWAAGTASDAKTTSTADGQERPSAKAAGALSGPLQRLAKALSPDCDDPYNTCFVERDKCEFAGDAICKK